MTVLTDAAREALPQRAHEIISAAAELAQRTDGEGQVVFRHIRPLFSRALVVLSVHCCSGSGQLAQLHFSE